MLIDGFVHAVIALAYPMEGIRRPILAKEVQRSIRRSPIDNDVLDRSIRLPCYRCEAGAHRLDAVENRGDDTDEWISHAHVSSNRGM